MNSAQEVIERVMEPWDDFCQVTMAETGYVKIRHQRGAHVKMSGRLILRAAGMVLAQALLLVPQGPSYRAKLVRDRKVDYAIAALAAAAICGLIWFYWGLASETWK